MAKQIINKLVVGLLVVLYPLIVYFGLMHFSPRVLAVVFVALAIARLLAQRLLSDKTKIAPGSVLPWLLALAVGLIYTLLSGSALGLLFYPVLINAALFILFTYSWLRPPSIIERFARLREPDLPTSGVRYTRKVTLVWAGFFLVNGSIAAATITLGRDWWAIYNGFIAYILIGTLFLVEWVVRQRARKHA